MTALAAASPSGKRVISPPKNETDGGYNPDAGGGIWTMPPFA